MSAEDLPMPIDRRTFVRRAAWTGMAAMGTLGHAVRSPLEASESLVGRRVRVLVWCEGTARRSVYPRDIDGALAEFLGRRPALTVRRARLGDESAGLSDQSLDSTDVLIWWGRLRHDDVPADRTAAVVDRVRAGR